MSRAIADDDLTRQSKAALMRDGLRADTADNRVPDVIVRSWRRCVSVSVPQQAVDVPYLDAVDRHTQLVESAAAVFDRLGSHLDGIDVALFLSDSHGQIVLRQVSDRRRRDVYDNASAAEGFDFSEEAIGTNGLGTVITERQPVLVHGSQHFNEALEPLTCAGVPIFKPYTRQVVGSFALACRAESANPLMYGMALDVGRQIETNLAGMQGDRERALAQAYLTAGQAAHDPVIVVSDHTAMANTLGLHYLSNESHALLWSRLANSPIGEVAARTDVPLAGGMRPAVVQRVAGSGDDATYLVRLLPPRRARTRPALRRHATIVDPKPRPAAHDHSPLFPLASVADALAAASVLGEAVVVGGRAGTGKQTTARRLLQVRHDFPDPFVVDLAARPAPGWQQHAAAALDRGHGVLLTHLQHLPARGATLVSRLARRTTAGAGPLVVTVDLDASPRHVQALVRRIGTYVELPPLHTMSELIPEFIRQQLAQLPAAGRPHGFSSSALQAMMRWEWPGDLAELCQIVEQVGRRLPGRTVDVTDLPPHLQAAARSHRLTSLQAAERDAIVTALHQHGGNRTEAAATLGIGRSTLYRKMRTYRLGGA